ncbi:MAG: Fis family transcriptional regulator [Thiobacillaceae bacterium]|nr:Fis family transcriptional regulator [Thiobacillaceae bacterium]MDW8323505.1 helix-turn-helix domain-containing protein [Burkholderiales bacterium]
MKQLEDNELAACVRRELEQYLKDLDGEAATGIYDMVMRCVERPTLEVVLNHTAGNQSRAAEMLGINRNTLRKKMQQYGLK